MADACVQMSYETFEVIGSEDCLFLNIYTIINRQKISASNILMPVLFWIHGGSYNIGSSSSDLNKPDFIIEKVCNVRIELQHLDFLSIFSPIQVGNCGRNYQLSLGDTWVFIVQ